MSLTAHNSDLLNTGHHKCIDSVDYEHTASAVGFVMGHNLHRNYWDSNAHLYDDAAARRSPGFGPWQDLSTRVKGPVLYDLNHNFCKAWDREAGLFNSRKNTELWNEREALEPRQFMQPVGTAAQICRTQPQEAEETSIHDLYIKALGTCRNYVV